ncbi:MAG TPA: hypothetical protein DEQ80_01790 [Anaerolinea thermolimosa]|uniref:PDZ domain-containing protein n=1 Tax=Anaerolinea thermolimosa TaxID=229919 RepID=A0A3D1JDB3_9CHLR|nr:hypothetical protein [Anaerolinea thermolimosa]
MNKSVRIFLGVMIVLLLLAGAFSGGLVVGWLLPDRAQAAFPLIGTNSTGAQPDATTDLGSSAGTPTQYKELFKPFWEAWQIVKDQYVDQPVDEQKMMQGAIRGMLESLGDPHTSYMDPDEYRQANLPMNGEYEGIGAWVDTTGDYVKIVSPMPGSPAEKAGLKANDIIIKVDGEDMTGIDGNLVLRRILGPAGTSVTLTIQREGLDAPFDVTITRAKIIIPSVEGKMLDGNIAYIQLFTFGEKTTGELKTKLRELMAQNPKGLILDLRNNGGGYLNTAIEVVSQFIDKGVVMYEEYGNGQRKTFQALPGGLATKIPLVVLVNEGTASASEITAGAIQDYGRGILVGVTTYGKGSVQSWIPLENNQGAVRVTIARWLTPKERQISKIGLKPDVEVPLTEEDIKNGKDPQLDKAIEIINQGGVNP